MTMAQSNSMGAESDLLFGVTVCVCFLSQLSLPLFHSYHVVFFPICLLFVSAPSCLVFFYSLTFSLSYLFVFFCPFYLLAVLSLSFLSWSGSLCSQLSVICLSMNESILSFYLHPLPIIGSLFIYFLFLSLQFSVSLYRSGPPSMCVPLCICMILEL